MLNRYSPGLAAGIALCCLMAGPVAAQQLPPPQVSILSLQPEPLPIVNELPGRVAATRIAEVRPRVGGIVIDRVFEQGGKVAAGDVLYRIDPAPFDVRVMSAKATLARAQATALNAADQEKRARALRERNVTAGADLDNATTALAQAEADVAIARASLQEAELNRSYTEVTAPISGVVGRALVTEGALVNAQSDNMATIQQLDPVYVDFTQSSSELFALRRAQAAGQLETSAEGEARVELIFDDGSEYAHAGKLLFSEASVDASTGQITLRAEFPNPDGNLLPGLYVRVRIEQAVRDNALTVPQMAVQRDQTGQAYVYALKDADTVERRNVTLGHTTDNRWLVIDGLAAGDRVVVAGAQKLYPDAKVVAQPAAAPAQKPVPAGAAAAAEAPQAGK